MPAVGAVKSTAISTVLPVIVSLPATSVATARIVYVPAAKVPVVRVYTPLVAEVTALPVSAKPDVWPVPEATCNCTFQIAAAV